MSTKKNIKGKPRDKEDNHEFSKCNDLKKGNIETQTGQDCIGKNSETKKYIKTSIEHFLKAKEGRFQCKKCDKIFPLDTEREHEGKQYMEKNWNMTHYVYKHSWLVTMIIIVVVNDGFLSSSLVESPDFNLITTFINKNH